MQAAFTALCHIWSASARQTPGENPPGRAGVASSCFFRIVFSRSERVYGPGLEGVTVWELAGVRAEDQRLRGWDI